MAHLSNLYYPQLRKLDFPIVKCPGGVSAALRQHRETALKLIPAEERHNWLDGGWLDPPASPGLPSIFGYGDPVPPPAPLAANLAQAGDAVAEEASVAPSIESGDDDEHDDDDDDEEPEMAQPAPKIDEAVKNGLDEATKRLVQELSQGARRSGRAPRRGPAKRAPAAGQPSASPSPPPRPRKRKRQTCADDDDDSSPAPEDPSTSPSPSPGPPKKRRARPALPPLGIPAARAAAPPPPPPPPPPPLSRLREQKGDMVGRPLPGAVQAEVAFISAMERLPSGWPSRNSLRKADETSGEVSRKTGYLKTVRRGGSLRRWFGDEAVFGMGMWLWLVGEHADGDQDDG